SVIGHNLQIQVMRRHYAKSVPPIQFIQNNFGKRTPEVWIASAAQFIDKIFHVEQMRGICAEVKFDALCVSNVNKDLREDSHFRSRVYRHKQPALYHYLVKADRFHRY